MTTHHQSEPLFSPGQIPLAVQICSKRELEDFNRTSGIAVHLGVLNAVSPRIDIRGSQSASLSLWETRSPSGFVTKPRGTADLVTVRFVTSGQVVYRHRRGDLQGSPTHATLAAFEGLEEVLATDAFVALSGTISIPVLAAAQEALTGGEDTSVPPLAPVADMSAIGMRALFATLVQAHRRRAAWDQDDDLVFPLVQEILSYQLLSAWPKRIETVGPSGFTISSHSLAIALDYIHAQLSDRLTLSEVAKAAGISVRSLQEKFRKEIGQTPVKYIIDQRLARAHEDLLSASKASLSIADIARRWGFVHISDFGQRYRRTYRRTPSDTRRDAGHAH